MAEARAYAVLCSGLPAGPRPAGYAARVHTTAPTLFIVGELDPQDPPEHLATREADVPNHAVVVLPGEAHATSSQASACRLGLLTAFITGGSLGALDLSCAADHRPPPFTYGGEQARTGARRAIRDPGRPAGGPAQSGVAGRRGASPAAERAW